jgi:hypothetical protein
MSKTIHLKIEPQLADTTGFTFGIDSESPESGELVSKKEPQDHRTFRVLARQEHSVGLQNPTSFPITVGKYACRIFFKPSQADPSLQRGLGGADIQIEFQADESDLVRAAALGISLIEDVLAGFGVVTGVPFGSVEFVHLVDITITEDTPFLFMLSPHHRHSDKPVSDADITHVQSMLAHWDHLPTGKRVRRAGRLYWRMLREDDDIVSFQKAYMGLEALEKPLAELTGVPNGVEEVKGKCDKCGAEFTRKKTVLNGVRAYIRGAKHPDPASSAQREKEWKQINDLRQDIFHSLEDIGKVRAKSYEVLVAPAHHLHDAICCLSHAHDLESPEYRLRRGAKQMLLLGIAQPGIQDTLEECRPILTLKDLQWEPHAEHGFVPLANIVHNRNGTDIGGKWFWLTKPLDLATEDDLEPANIEPVNSSNE